MPWTGWPRELVKITASTSIYTRLTTTALWIVSGSPFTAGSNLPITDLSSTTDCFRFPRHSTAGVCFGFGA